MTISMEDAVALLGARLREKRADPVPQQGSLGGGNVNPSPPAGFQMPTMDQAGAFLQRPEVMYPLLGAGGLGAISLGHSLMDEERRKRWLGNTLQGAAIGGGLGLGAAGIQRGVEFANGASNPNPQPPASLGERMTPGNWLVDIATNGLFPEKPTRIQGGTRAIGAGVGTLGGGAAGGMLGGELDRRMDMREQMGPARAEHARQLVAHEEGAVPWLQNRLSDPKGPIHASHPLSPILRHPDATTYMNNPEARLNGLPGATPSQHRQIQQLYEEAHPRPVLEPYILPANGARRVAGSRIGTGVGAGLGLAAGAYAPEIGQGINDLAKWIWHHPPGGGQ